MKRIVSLLSLAFLLTCGVASIAGCGSSVDELLDTVEDPDRKPIDRSRLGVNNFFVNSFAGTTSQQYQDITQTLGIRYVRVLLAWTDAVQSSPSSAANFSFFDQILNSAPPGTKILVVVAHTPNWMTNPANWIDGNPRTTWIERWFRPVVERYSGNAAIEAWEVWNEPDFTVVPSDTVLGLNDPANYFELLSMGAAVIRSTTPGKLVVMAATRSIQQDFSTHLDYNRALRDLGAQDIVDVWNIHFYGKQYERVVQNDGVADFLNSLGKVIWITESGEQDPNMQLDYVERTWPFLKEKIPGIDRYYYYEYASTAPLASNFGLRTNDPVFPVSDLYIELRDG